MFRFYTTMTKICSICENFARLHIQINWSNQHYVCHLQFLLIVGSFFNLQQFLGQHSCSHQWSSVNNVVSPSKSVNQPLESEMLVIPRWAAIHKASLLFSMNWVSPAEALRSCVCLSHIASADSSFPSGEHFSDLLCLEKASHWTHLLSIRPWFFTTVFSVGTESSSVILVQHLHQYVHQLVAKNLFYHSMYINSDSCYPYFILLLWN
jgi:hypothetical protein